MHGKSARQRKKKKHLPKSEERINNAAYVFAKGGSFNVVPVDVEKADGSLTQKGLLLVLLDRYNVQAPLRTIGVINNNITGIIVKEGEISYYGKISQSKLLFDVLRELQKKIIERNDYVEPVKPAVKAEVVETEEEKAQ